MAAAVEASFDQAIRWYQAGQLDQARDALHGLLERAPDFGQAWNALGYVERDRDQAAAAAAAFDRALALTPDDPTARRGRARLALERQEREAPARYAELIAAAPGDLPLQLEAIEARISTGDDGAIAALQALAAARPDWTEGQIALARLLWEERRDPDFDRHLRERAARGTLTPALWRGWIGLLNERDTFGAAADRAAEARAVCGDSADWRLFEAVLAGRDGQLERADGLFATLPAALPGRAFHESLLRLRQGDYARAVGLIDAALAETPDDVSAWGVAELLYRQVGDPRAAWLSGQHGLTRTLLLDLDPGLLDTLAPLLRGLVADGAELAGQSVRQGRQTRWRLFDRAEPELAALRTAIERAIETYRAGLPPADPAHPLLRHRDAPLRITGSWSVRLTGGGHHVSHIHHLGLISSACYIVVPGDAGGRLELGRPPPDFRLDLAPLHTVTPRPGELTLFPCYLHHGTTPFSAGERISVAFDVRAV